MQATAFATLNFQQPNFVTVYAAQNDKLTRFVNVALLDGSMPWTPPVGALMTVKYRRGDGVGGFYDTLEDDSPACVVQSNGTVTIGLAEQLLAVAGVSAVELRFYNAAGEVLSTACFRVIVQPSAWADDEIIESEPYINVLSQQIAAVLDAATAYTDMQASATTGAPGSSASVTVTGGTDGQPYNLAFTIPRGDVGPTGPQGPPGADGDGAVNTVMGVGSVQGDVPAAQLFNLIYPVGAIYISTSSTNPGTLFGGTWARVKDTFLLAAGDTYAAGATGGSATHTLTVDELPPHTHALTDNQGGGVMSWPSLPSSVEHAPSNWGTTSSSPQVENMLATGSTGDGAAMSIMPPYLAVYVWQRTALAS
jgi:hypothetical protein